MTMEGDHRRIIRERKEAQAALDDVRRKVRSAVYQQMTLMLKGMAQHMTPQEAMAIFHEVIGELDALLLAAERKLKRDV